MNDLRISVDYPFLNILPKYPSSINYKSHRDGSKHAVNKPIPSPPNIRNNRQNLPDPGQAFIPNINIAHIN